MRYNKFLYGAKKYETPQYIHDRVQADVTNLTPKGYLNVTDINRIEWRCKEIAEMFTAIGFETYITTKYNWTKNDFIYRADIERIRDNVQLMINHYAQAYPTIEHTLKPNFEDINALEKSLCMMQELILNIKNGWHKYCGSFLCGGNTIGG